MTCVLVVVAKNSNNATVSKNTKMNKSAVHPDELFMQRCIALAYNGLRYTKSNPMVGAVIVHNGRIIGEGEPKYLNSPETAVYTKGQHLFGMSHSRDSIRQRDYGILVEGYLDFLIPFQEGVRNLVASLGTALTENQVRLLGRYTRKIVVNFDPDSAGVSATKRSLEMLLGEGFKVNVLTLPDNLDPDEFVRARGADGYLKLLKHSQAFLDYIVEQAVAHPVTREFAVFETP